MLVRRIVKSMSLPVYFTLNSNTKTEVIPRINDSIINFELRRRKRHWYSGNFEEAVFETRLLPSGLLVGPRVLLSPVH
jgi:hypothetical protein